MKKVVLHKHIYVYRNWWTNGLKINVLRNRYHDYSLLKRVCACKYYLQPSVLAEDSLEEIIRYKAIVSVCVCAHYLFHVHCSLFGAVETE